MWADFSQNLAKKTCMHAAGRFQECSRLIPYHASLVLKTKSSCWSRTSSKHQPGAWVRERKQENQIITPHHRKDCGGQNSLQVKKIQEKNIRHKKFPWYSTGWEAWYVPIWGFLHGPTMASLRVKGGCEKSSIWLCSCCAETGTTLPRISEAWNFPG